MNEASGSEILVSDLVRGLVQGRSYRFEDRGKHQLRGFEEPVRLFALDWRNAAEQNEQTEAEGSIR